MSKQNNINEYLKTPYLDGIELLNAQNCTINFPFHKHETYNISLILENTFRTDLKDKSFIAPSGSIAITNANELHATPCDKNIGNSFFTFYIPPTIIKHIGGLDNLRFDNRVIQNKKIFNDFLWLSKKQNIYSEFFEKCLLNALSALVKKCEVRSTKEKLDKSLKLFVTEVITEEENFSLDKIASKFGINKYKFIRLFKEETGLTPKYFMMLKRIEKSKSLLRLGHSIFDVAIDCGFYDCPHFYKYFKRYTGVNPLEFQSSFIN